MLGELPKYVPAVNVTPTFSIYSSTTKERLFCGVYDIQSDPKSGCKISFIHNGVRKWTVGDVWIEPEPPHGDAKKIRDLEKKLQVLDEQLRLPYQWGGKKGPRR